MPVAVIVIVGGPAGAGGAGVGDGAATGVGARVRAVAEHAASEINEEDDNTHTASHSMPVAQPAGYYPLPYHTQMLYTETRKHGTPNDFSRMPAGIFPESSLCSVILCFRVMYRYQPWRRVVIGSTDAARRAGSKQATSATTQSSAGTAMNVSGSSVPTP